MTMMMQLKYGTFVTFILCCVLSTSQTYAQLQQRTSTNLENRNLESPRLNEGPMPMHRRFLLERQHHKILSSDPVTRNTEGGKKIQKHYYNPLDHNKRLLDVLSSPWWVRLHEGEREPETRRAHAAAIFEIVKGGSGGGAAVPDVGTDLVEPVPSEQDTQPPQQDEGHSDLPIIDPKQTPPQDEGHPDPQETDPESDKNTSDRTEDQSRVNDDATAKPAENPISATPESPSETTPTPESPVPVPGQRNLSKETLQEYMMITGGFTDDDWNTFPVWAYDMTAATLDDNGHWYELTPPNNIADDVCASNVTDVGIDYAQPCAPSSRVGHISIVRDGSLYVFGGLGYNDHEGVFVMEEEPYMYSMRLSEEYFVERDYENYNGDFDFDVEKTDTLYWKRWLPKVTAPTNDPFFKQTDLSRGEVRGGYWEKEDKLIIFGGLHVRQYETNTGRLQQADTPLSDIWAYDFKTDTWEMLDSQCPGGQCTLNHPGERTSHAATIVGDELVVYGGLRKVDTYLWDGSTLWSQLDDIWIFDLNTLKWRQRYMGESMGRAYHAVVGWQMPNTDGAILATIGGFRTMRDPVDNQQISSVYDDTMVSMPQVHNTSQPSVWFLATCNSLHSVSETISTRLEHSAVLSRAHGNMIVWGGRFRETKDVNGVWSLNIAGAGSTLEYTIRTDDSEMGDPGMAYVLLVTVMMTSMMFTYMCGVVHRRMEEDAGINLDTLNGEPTAPSSVFGRNGLGQDIIDTLPLKKFQNESEGGAAQPSNEESNRNRSDFSFEDEEECCPICLVEYEVGDDIRCLPCNHEFHKSCVDPWLGHNASCPACRHSLSDLASMTTSSDIAAQIRATISARMRPAAIEEPTETQQNQDPLPRHPSSQPSSPDQAIAPGVRGLESLRRFFNNTRRRNQLESAGSRDSHDGDIEVVGDLELSYSSSLELSDGNSSNDSSFDAEDMPIERRSRRPRIVNTARQRLMRERRQESHGQDRRRRGGRGRGRRSALNTPLQPSDGSIV
jgi:hypothetical protein